MFLKFIFGLIGVLGLVKFYFVYSAKKCTNHVSLVGKTVIVTGANSGIGFCSALEFAKRGARVILACRNEDRAKAARDYIVKLTENENVAVTLVDMASFDSIRKCAKEILANEERLDILVNNAGAGGLLEKKTEDGFEVLMQINYFGPVLFTFLLLELLRKSPKARIINVSSIMAKMGECRADNFNQYAGRYGTYNNSKLCFNLFTMKLAEKLKSIESKVSVFSLHPGAVKTDIFRRVKSWKKVVLSFVAYFSFKTPEEGAQTIIYTATESNIEDLSGSHFEECEAVPPYTKTLDDKLSQEIWDETLRLLNINEQKILQQTN